MFHWILLKVERKASIKSKSTFTTTKKNTNFWFNKYHTTTKRDNEFQDLEEFLRVHDLKVLKKIFNKAIKKKVSMIYETVTFDLNAKQKKIAGI